MKEKSFKKYIHQLLKTSGPDYHITKQGLVAMDRLLRVVAEQLVDKVLMFNDKKTITSMEIVTALRLMCNEEISKGAIFFANNKLMKFQESEEERKNSKENKSVSRESRCGLTFSVSAAEKYVRKFDLIDMNVSSNSSIYLAAILEYLCNYIFSKTIVITTEQKKVNITVRHIFLAVSNDTNLSFIKDIGITFLECGVEPENIVCKRRGPKSCPGSKTAMNIRTLQKGSDMLLQHAPFNRLVREIVSKLKHLESPRYTKEFFYYLQAYSEYKLIELMRNSNKIANHSERETVYAKDINLVLSLDRMSLSDQKFNSNIPEASLRQMALRAGIRRYGECCSVVYRQFLSCLLYKLLDQILICQSYHKLHTLTAKVLIECLRMNGVNPSITYQKRKTYKKGSMTTNGETIAETMGESTLAESTLAESTLAESTFQESLISDVEAV